MTKQAKIEWDTPISDKDLRTLHTMSVTSYGWSWEVQTPTDLKKEIRYWRSFYRHEGYTIRRNGHTAVRTNDGTVEQIDDIFEKSQDGSFFVGVELYEFLKSPKTYGDIKKEYPFFVDEPKSIELLLKKIEHL